MVRPKPERTPPMDRPAVCIQRPYIVGDLPGNCANDVCAMEIKYMGEDGEHLWRLRIYNTTAYNVRKHNGLSHSPFMNEGMYEDLVEAIADYNMILDSMTDQDYMFWRSCPMTVGPDNWRWPPNFAVHGVVGVEMQQLRQRCLALPEPYQALALEMWKQAWEDKVSSLVGQTFRPPLEEHFSRNLRDLGMSVGASTAAAKRFNDAMDNVAPPEPNPLADAAAAAKAINPKITGEQVNDAIRVAEERNRYRQRYYGNQWNEPSVPRLWLGAATIPVQGDITWSQMDEIDEMLEPPEEPPEPDDPPEPPPDVWDMLEV